MYKYISHEYQEQKYILLPRTFDLVVTLQSWTYKNKK